MGSSEPVKFQVGQSFGTFENYKAQLEARAKSKREGINAKIIKREELTTYLDKKDKPIGLVLVGTEPEYSNSGVLPPKKEDLKNKGLIEIGDVAYFIPVIRDGKGGQVYKITQNGKTIAIDKNHDGIIGEDELIFKNIDTDKK